MEKYILVLWPESQSFMEEDWFSKECYLCQAFNDQQHHDSAYFIPNERYEQFQVDHYGEVAIANRDNAE